jgi:hypothetical protein
VLLLVWSNRLIIVRLVPLPPGGPVYPSFFRSVFTVERVGQVKSGLSVNWVSPVAVEMLLPWPFGPLSLLQSPLGELFTFIVPRTCHSSS